MPSTYRATFVLALSAVAWTASEASAATPERMMADCRSRAGRELRTRLPNIETTYEGQRTNGTHAVNGTAHFSDRVETFQCSFNAGGFRLLRFLVNAPAESTTAVAATQGQMMARCRARAGRELRVRLPDIDTTYEGQAGDGTHTVNGIVESRSRNASFRCSLNTAGDRIIAFKVDRNPAARPAAAKGDAIVPGTSFNATGNLNCARAAGQPMASCRFGVVRTGGGSGTVTIFWPDGGNRVITFRGGVPVAYDVSQADGSASLQWTRSGDLTIVTIGTQRFEIVDAIVWGG